MDPEKRATAKELMAHDFIKCECSNKQIRKKMTAVFVTDALSERGLV
tara:strand:- start:337 stop:477 length:141 start_codon:yes stop_codon:yes gene_type:complete